MTTSNLPHLASVNPSALPLYIQISELLTREILAGRWVHGDRLPPENELSKQLGVSVGTLRKALAELDTRGQIERRQGSGTYVRSSSETIQRSIYEFFRLELLRGGGLPTASIISFATIDKPDFVPLKNRRCYRVRRLRSLNSLPIAIEEIYFDASVHPKVQVEDLGEALYLFYQQKLGFWISHTEDRIGQGVVPAWSPSLFAPAVGTLCPQIARDSWTSEQHIEEFSITWFDPQRAHYVCRLK